jgi:truncated hemoglobin YjbI
MSLPSYDTILNIVKSFYATATSDFLIGYHFRVIADFEEHFPRIADFWQLQLTGEMDHPKSLPFNLIKTHTPLKFKRGEVDRWVKLFEENLDNYVNSHELSSENKKLWMEKVQFFKERMYAITSDNQ